jgi:hypothetical protein
VSERCELSELPVDQCACRIHAPNPYAVERNDIAVTARFRARFDSECDSCGNAMDQGDLIGRTKDGDYICGECAS